MNIHTYAQVIPYNPDNLPEAGLVTGPGTERPVGFINLDRIAKLYWSIRSFKVSVAAVPLLDFTFEAFLLGGGSTGTALGSLFGLATASLTQPIPIFFQGQTTCSHIFSKKVRRTRDGVYQNMTQEEFFGSLSSSTSSNNASKEKTLKALDIDPDIKPNYLVSETEDPTEALSVAPGLYHTLFNSYGALFINFADVVYAKRQYWPKILLFIKNPVGGSVWRSAIVIRDPLFSASLNRLPDRESFSYTIPTLATPNIGGVSFDGGLIQLFGQGDLNTYSIFGSISYPTASEINKQLKKSSSTSE